MKCGEWCTLKKRPVQKRAIQFVQYVIECIDFFNKMNTLSYIYSLLTSYSGSCVSMSVGHSPHSARNSAYPCHSHCVCLGLSGPVFLYTIFVSIFIFCLFGRHLLVSYSMYCTVLALNLQKIFCLRFPSTCMEHAGQFPPSL
jgi:hypothetical protein